MGYYIRVLSTSAGRIALDTLTASLKHKKLKASLRVESGTKDEWDQIVLLHDDDQEIAIIERNVVEDLSLGAEELDEFRIETSNCKPASSAQWLAHYFQKVRCIYAFQVLSGTEHKNGWEILGALKSSIWNQSDSIFQADHEGFSNEDGYHILWQFSESVKGDWWMGVLREGAWVHFQMDLGNQQHRTAFLNGEVPEGVLHSF